MEALRSPRRGRRAWAAGAILAAAFAGGLAGALTKRTSELPVYTRAAARMGRGEPIYRPREPKPFTYPPFFALPFVPLAALPEGAHRTVWYLANVAALALVLLLLWRAIRPFLSGAARGPPVWVFAALVALLAARHVTAVFENQSHDLLVMLAVVLSVVASARRREVGAGFWSGAGAACKATPLLFAPVFLWQRRFTAALVAVLAAVALTLLPDLVAPQNGGTSWVVTWYDAFAGKLEVGDAPEAAGAWSRWNILNQSLTGTLYRLSTPVPNTDAAHFDVSLWNPGRDVLRWVLWGAQLAVLAFVAVVTRPARTRGLGRDEVAFRRLAEGGAVVAAMVLLSPMSSKSHFCVLVLPIAVALADFLYRRRDRVLGILLAAVFVSGTLTIKGLLGRRLGNEVLARGSVTLCALACLLAAGHVLFHRRARDSDAGG